MRKSIPFIASLLLVSSVVACKNPAKDVPAATVTDAAQQAPAAAAPEAPVEVATQTIALNGENTKIGFIGSKVTGVHEGGFNTVTGELHIAGTPESINGHIDIDMNSIYSDAEDLTRHLLSNDFFAVTENPTSRFTVTSVGNEVDGIRTVSGRLLLRGVEKEIAFPATIAVTDAAVTMNAEFKINRRDFNIVYDGKADDLIRDEVVIKINVNGARPN